MRTSINVDAEGNDKLDSNFWTGDSMAYQVTGMDDFDPVAPMDRVGEPGSGGTPVLFDDGNPHLPGVLVPPYLYPDPFPEVQGPHCNCTLPANKSLDVLCKCSKGAELESKWLRMEPVYNSSDYTLTPADVSFTGGNYWIPRLKTVGGIVAPMDRYPTSAYPAQAPKDRFRPLPAVAREDRIRAKVARYIDQVEYRSEECDKVSVNCTVPCEHGNQVNLTIGNTFVGATVIGTLPGNALTVKFAPAEAKDTTGGVDCTASNFCTMFRPCKYAKGCVAQEVQPFFNFADQLYQKRRCPEGTVVCRTIEQTVAASSAVKGSKPCRVA